MKWPESRRRRFGRPYSRLLTANLAYSMAISLAFGVATAIGTVVWTITRSSNIGGIAGSVAIGLLIVPFLRFGRYLHRGLSN